MENEDRVLQDSNRREYIRISTVFPIEFQLIDSNNQATSDLVEAFTNDVGRGGMAITAKTLRGKGPHEFKLVPHETRLKVFINVPVQKEPVEAIAMVEWVSHSSGSLLDECVYGVSFEAIDAPLYEKIIGYVRWLRWRPRVNAGVIILLIGALLNAILLIADLQRKNIEVNTSLVSARQEQDIMVSRTSDAADMQEELFKQLAEAERKESLAVERIKRLEEDKSSIERNILGVENELADTLERFSEISDDRDRVEEELSRMQDEYPEEELIEKEELLVDEGEEEGGISASRIKSEVSNYKRIRGYALNEKIQSLESYCYSNRSSIYHAAALFALSELRFKSRDENLAEINYIKIINTYPKSIYALYSSYRLEQIRAQESYGVRSLVTIYKMYNISTPIDYREIRPYVE